MASRRDLNLELSIFADALRCALGLDPIYRSGDRPNDDDIVRFYIEPYSERKERTPRRGAS